MSNLEQVKQELEATQAKRDFIEKSIAKTKERIEKQAQGYIGIILKAFGEPETMTVTAPPITKKDTIDLTVGKAHTVGEEFIEVTYYSPDNQGVGRFYQVSLNTPDNNDYVYDTLDNYIDISSNWLADLEGWAVSAQALLDKQEIARIEQEKFKADSVIRRFAQAYALPEYEEKQVVWQGSQALEVIGYDVLTGEYHVFKTRSQDTPASWTERYGSAFYISASNLSANKPALAQATQKDFERATEATLSDDPPSWVGLSFGKVNLPDLPYSEEFTEQQRENLAQNLAMFNHQQEMAQYKAGVIYQLSIEKLNNLKGYWDYKLIYPTPVFDEYSGWTHFVEILGAYNG